MTTSLGHCCHSAFLPSRPAAARGRQRRANLRCTEVRAAAAGKHRQSPKDFSLRSASPSKTNAVFTADALPASSPPSILERKQIAQENEEKKPFRVTEVDAAEVLDFYPAPVLAVTEEAPGVRCITLEAEASREFVPLDRAYTKPGQAVCVRLPSSSKEQTVHVSSAPFSGATNFEVLYKLRGDIPAGSTKAPQYALSVKSPLDLHVEESRNPELFRLNPGDTVEVGWFGPTGIDLRPIMFLSRFPTILIFASGPGAGIATVRALIEAEDVGSLYLPLRADVRLFYAAKAQTELAYKDKFQQWEALNVRVRPVVASASEAWDGLVGDFATAFDQDDVEYDPETTGAVVAGDAASNKAALQVLEEAGVPESSILVWEAPN